MMFKYQNLRIPISDSYTLPLPGGLGPRSPTKTYMTPPPGSPWHFLMAVGGGNRPSIKEKFLFFHFNSHYAQGKGVGYKALILQLSLLYMYCLF